MYAEASAGHDLSASNEDLRRQFIDNDWLDPEFNPRGGWKFFDRGSQAAE